MCEQKRIDVDVSANNVNNGFSAEIVEEITRRSADEFKMFSVVLFAL
jgi:hypothetical protein